MDSYIIGTVRSIFYKTDSGFMVGMFKIKETTNENLNDYINKTITFCGNFHELLENSNYKFYGETSNHPKYGFQYKVNYYEKIIPEEKNSIITFLSSGLFPGIGEKTATKIVEKLGDNTLDLILEDYNNLLLVPSIKEEKAKMIYEILYDEQMSYKTILYLQELGFSINESVKIYEKYKEKTGTIIENNIYTICDDIVGIGFLTVDKISIKKGMDVDDERRIEASIVYSINELCMESGSTYLSFDEIYLRVYKYLNIDLDINNFEYYILNLNKKGIVVIKDDKYTLKKNYDLESNIADKLVHLTRIGETKVNLNNIIKSIENLFDIKYNKLQKKAIVDSITNNVTVITGGPGTGKTTIIKGIVETYKQIYSLRQERLVEEVTLLAPTGRAARRITEATCFPASTIHKFLKWDKENDTFQVNENAKSPTKMVIIDEASMIDIFLFNSLLNGLKDDVKLVIVGDYNQLPSVLCGEILKNIIDSDVIPVVKLDELYRQKEDSYIINFANEVNSGKLSDEFINKKSDYNFIEVPKDGINKIVCDLCKKAIEKGYNYSDIQVLVPMYKGLNGIDNLNKKLQDIFNPQNGKKDEYVYEDITFREGDKVLQTKNINELEISNGDIGIIDSITKTKDGIGAIINFDGNIVEFNKKNFEDLKLGYAISIHKSQGSEFDVVIMPMDESYKRMLYRKLIYTGVTRAKKSLILVGEKDALISGVSKVSSEVRNTFLCDMLIERIN